jgi:hypothetical protein
VTTPQATPVTLSVLSNDVALPLQLSTPTNQDVLTGRISC